MIENIKLTTRTDSGSLIRVAAKIERRDGRIWRFGAAGVHDVKEQEAGDDEEPASHGIRLWSSLWPGPSVLAALDYTMSKSSARNIANQPWCSGFGFGI